MRAVDAATSSTTPPQEEADLKDAALWVEAHKAEVPICVYNAVILLVTLRAELANTKARAAKLLALLRRELGVTPKSERGQAPSSSSKVTTAKSDEERLAALKARRAKLLAEIRRYEDRLGKGRKSRRKAKTPAEPAKTSPEAADPALQPSGEVLFSGNIAERAGEKAKLAINRVENFENPRGLHSATDERTRYDYGVTTKTITLQVETVTDPRTGKSVTASTVRRRSASATFGMIRGPADRGVRGVQKRVVGRTPRSPCGARLVRRQFSLQL